MIVVAVQSCNRPWRRTAPPNEWPIERWLQLWSACQDDGFNIMACHKSTEEAPTVCLGWVRVLGFDAIGVRLAAFQGLVTLEEIADQMEGDLYFDFAEVMKANAVDPATLRRNRFLL